MRRWVTRREMIGAIALTITLSACESERREFRVIPPAGAPDELTPLSDLRAGGAGSSESTTFRYGSNAHALKEGQTLYHRMNCVGCHYHGGGGIGPALMDAEWIYGSDPAQIFKSIVEGRPNGMPSYKGKLGNQQVWQLVAYVRSLSGLDGSVFSSSREDHLFLSPNLVTRKSENPGSRGRGTAPKR